MENASDMKKSNHVIGYLVQNNRALTWVDDARDPLHVQMLPFKKTPNQEWNIDQQGHMYATAARKNRKSCPKQHLLTMKERKHDSSFVRLRYIHTSDSAASVPASEPISVRIETVEKELGQVFFFLVHFFLFQTFGGLSLILAFKKIEGVHVAFEHKGETYRITSNWVEERVDAEPVAPYDDLQIFQLIPSGNDCPKNGGVLLDSESASALSEFLGTSVKKLAMTRITMDRLLTSAASCFSKGKEKKKMQGIKKIRE